MSAAQRWLRVRSEQSIKLSLWISPQTTVGLEPYCVGIKPHYWLFFFQFELSAARGCYHFTAVESVREGGARARVGGVTSNRHILLLHSNNSECFWKEEIPWPGKTHHFTAEATNREVWTQWPWEQHTGFDCRSEANVKQSWNQSSVSKSWETFTNKSLTWRQKEKHHSVISWRDEE